MRPSWTSASRRFGVFNARRRQVRDFARECSSAGVAAGRAWVVRGAAAAAVARAWFSAWPTVPVPEPELEPVRT